MTEAPFRKIFQNRVDTKSDFLFYLEQNTKDSSTLSGRTSLQLLTIFWFRDGNVQSFPLLNQNTGILLAKTDQLSRQRRLLIQRNISIQFLIDKHQEVNVKNVTQVTLVL
jgi:hypothetical protein